MIYDRYLEYRYRLRQNFFGRIPLRPSLKSFNANQGPFQNQNLLYQDVFQKEVLTDPEMTDAPNHWIDVGSHLGIYVLGLAPLLKTNKITLIEADAHKRLLNLYRRKDYLKFVQSTLQKQGKNCELRFEPFLKAPLDLSGSTLITIFFPFVSEAPTHSWGLPKRFAHFHEQLLKIQGEFLFNPEITTVQIFSLHQGEWEAEAACYHYDQYFSNSEYEMKKLTQTHWVNGYPLFLFKTKLSRN